MQLSELIKIFEDVELVRDASFHKLGLTVHRELPDMLTYIRSEGYIETALSLQNASAFITTEEIARKIEDRTTCGIAVCDRPELRFFMFHNYLAKETDFYPKRDFSTVTGKDCRIAPGATIASRNVRIGDRTVIENGAVIEEGVSIGNDCFIGPNVVIGSRGFQYCRDHGKGIYVEHIAGVILEDHVDIFPGCCIAAGLFVPTILREEVKLDNLVHIAHSVCLERGVTLPAGVIFGGGVHVGENAWIGLNATVRQMTNVGADATVSMGAVVTRDVPDGEMVSGNFAINHQKNVAHMKRILSEG